MGNLDITQAGAWGRWSLLLSTRSSEPARQEGERGTFMSRRETDFSGTLETWPVDRMHFRAGI